MTVINFTPVHLEALLPFLGNIYFHTLCHESNIILFNTVCTQNCSHATVCSYKNPSATAVWIIILALLSVCVVFQLYPFLLPLYEVCIHSLYLNTMEEVGGFHIKRPVYWGQSCNGIWNQFFASRLPLQPILFISLTLCFSWALGFPSSFTKCNIFPRIYCLWLVKDCHI
jgi:hypothetical protein